MSVVDSEIEEREICNEHGCELPCRSCQEASIDLYADMKIQDAKEGPRHD